MERYKRPSYLKMKRIIVSLVLLLATKTQAGTPYFGKSFELPELVGASTLIEAEYFDQGYENNVEVFKTDDGLIYVGNIRPGEWMSYSIKNPIEGNFDIELRTSSAFETSTVELEVEGTKVKANIPYSGTWDSWRLLTVFNIKLPKGYFQFKTSTETGNFFIDSVRFIRRPN